MKRLIVALVISVLAVGNAMAQVTPDIDLKPGATSTVSAQGLNIMAVLELVDVLRASGAKVEARIESTKGMELMIIKANGKTISPVLLTCKDCEPIVFEY